MNTVCLKKHDNISIKCNKTNNAKRRRFAQSILQTYFSDPKTININNDNTNETTKTPTKTCCDNSKLCTINNSNTIIIEVNNEHRSSDFESISKENNTSLVHIDSNDRVSIVHHTELIKGTEGSVDVIPQNELNENSCFKSIQTSSDWTVNENESECKIETLNDSARDRKVFTLNSSTIYKTTNRGGVITPDNDHAFAGERDKKHVSFDEESYKNQVSTPQQKDLTETIYTKDNFNNDTKEEVLDCLEHRVITNTKKTKKKVFEQLYLDLGQKDFGKQIICPICGMLYIHGLIDDTKQHDNICIQYQQGVHFVVGSNNNNNKNNNAQPRIVDQFPCKMSSIERSSATNQGPKKRNRQVSSTTSKAYIVEIRQSDSNHCLKKLQDVISIAKQDIGFVGGGSHSEILSTTPLVEVDKPYTAYICVYNNRVIGLVIVEEIKVAYPLIKDNTQQPTGECNMNQKCNTSSLSRSLHSQPVMLGIYLLWVHTKYRHMGIAKKLIDVIRDKMFYGLHVPIDKIAFSSPTQAGLSFALKYCNTSSKDENNSQVQVVADDEASCVLVYDCDIRNRELFQLN